MAASTRKLSFIERKSSTNSMSSPQPSPRRKSSISSKFSFDAQGTGKKMSPGSAGLASRRKVSVAAGGIATRRPSMTGRVNVPPPLSRKSSNSSLPKTTGPPSPGRTLKFAIPESRSDQSQEGQEGATKIGFRQLLVTKRIARNLKLRTSQRLADKRGRSYVTYMDRPRRKTMSSRPVIRLEPTYKMEPQDKFAAYHKTIESILENILEGTLKDCNYDPTNCATLTQQLAGDIQAEVKDIELERYKLITIVHIGERNRQSVRVASRALWDPDVDSFVTHKFQNKSLFCTATVYGIYLE